FFVVTVSRRNAIVPTGGIQGLHFFLAMPPHVSALLYGICPFLMKKSSLLPCPEELPPSVIMGPIDEPFSFRLNADDNLSALEGFSQCVKIGGKGRVVVGARWRRLGGSPALPMLGEIG